MTPTATRARPTATANLTGTAVLLRFALRRDRVRLPAWILAISLSLVGLAAGLPGAYGDEGERRLRAELITDPAGVAFSGPRIGVDDYTIGAMLTNEMMGWTAVLVALMSILTVLRHTRAEEEAGRAELLRAGVVGRHAPLAAALAVAAIANAAVAATVAVGLGGAGIDSVDWAGSWLFGAALAGVGLVFAGVAAVTAQVSEHTGRSGGLAGLVVAAVFLVRAIGDVADSPLSWLSPIAWAQRTSPYVDDLWWPLLLPVACTAALTALAVALTSRRDVGSGLWPARRGPAAAADSLVNPYGLVWRLLRTGAAGWAAGILAFALLYGVLLGGIEDFAAELAAVRAILAGSDGGVVDALIAHLVSLLAIFSALYAGSFALLRARTDEARGLTEPVLAAGMGRVRWLWSHIAVSAALGTGILLVSALGLGAAGAVSTGDAGLVPSTLASALVYTAPLLLTVALAAACYGWVPSAARTAVWVLVGYALLVGKLGELFGVAHWAPGLSPFNAVPRMPAEDFAPSPVLLLLALSAVLVAAGFTGFRRRDVAA
ncbi:ABC transporter permease [Nocardiopsis oceani]